MLVGHVSSNASQTIVVQPGPVAAAAGPEGAGTDEAVARATGGNPPGTGRPVLLTAAPGTAPERIPATAEAPLRSASPYDPQSGVTAEVGEGVGESVAVRVRVVVGVRVRVAVGVFVRVPVTVALPEATTENGVVREKV